MKKAGISQIMLERYILGELPRQDIKRIAETLYDDKHLQNSVHALIKSNGSILRRYPASRMAESIQLRVRQRDASETYDIGERETNWFGSFKLRPAAAIVSGLALLLFVALPLYKQRLNNFSSAQETTRAKGLSSYINIYRKTGGGPEKLENLSIVKPGDIIQIGYVSASKTHGLILSLDGNKTVTLHFPEDMNRSTKLHLKGEKMLPNSYRLDRAPLFEHFFFITSDEQIDMRLVLNKAEHYIKNMKGAEKGSLLDLPPEYGQFSFILKKE